MNYRADIDGLRALAVISVCIYHAFPSALNGGFIGVDIFFVISGFLITSIIIKSIDDKTFSVVDFYAKRIKRIFPSLIFVFISSLLLGWYVLFDNEYYTLIKHISFGSIFSSNFLLWSESGYFDNDATTKPMLHLWSLAIEEQFYIIWPILILSLIKWNKKLVYPFLTITVFSLLANIYFSQTDQSTAFYMPLARFWEIAIGGIIAISMMRFDKIPNGMKHLISVMGISLLAIGLIFINERVQFPGYWALIPVIGTGLIIIAGSSAWPNRVLLSNKAMIFIGLISFPLYLWHWLFISMVHIAVQDPEPRLMVGALVLSVVCSLASYALLEKPIRHSKKAWTPIALACAMIATSMLGFYTYTQRPLPQRAVMADNQHLESGFDGGVSGLKLSYGCNIDGVELEFQGAKCLKGSDDNIRFAVIGDSKADVLAPGLFRTNTSSSGDWIFIGGNATDGAPIPIISDNPAYQRHQNFARETLDFLALSEEIEVIVIAVATRSIFNLRNDRDINDLPSSPYYDTALEGMQRGISRLVESGKKVIFIVDNPTLPPPASCLNRRTGSDFLNQVLSLEERESGCAIALDKHKELSHKYQSLLREMHSTAPNDIFILNTLPILCDQTEGVCETFKEGRALYSFTDHISDYAAGLIGQELNSLLSNMGNSPK